MRLTNYFPRLTKLAQDPRGYVSSVGGLPDYTTSYEDFKPKPLGSGHTQDDLQFTDEEAASIQPFKDPYNGYFIEEEPDSQSAPANQGYVSSAPGSSEYNFTDDEGTTIRPRQTTQPNGATTYNFTDDEGTTIRPRQTTQPNGATTYNFTDAEGSTIRPRQPQRQTPRLDSNGFNKQQAKVYDLYQQGRVAQDALPSSMRAQVARLDANRKSQQLLASRGYNRPGQSQLQATVGPSSYKPNTGEFNMNSPIPNSNPSAPRMQAVQAPKPQGIPNNLSSTNVGSRIPSVTAPNMSKSPLQLGNSNFKSMGSGNTSTKA